MEKQGQYWPQDAHSLLRLGSNKYISFKLHNVLENSLWAGINESYTSKKLSRKSDVVRSKYCYFVCVSTVSFVYTKSDTFR